MPKNPETYPKPCWPKFNMPKLLTGQKALVTGANSGIGQAVAEAMGQAGADVVVNYVRGDEAAQAVVDKIKSSGEQSHRYYGGRFQRRSSPGHVQEDVR